MADSLQPAVAILKPEHWSALQKAKRISVQFKGIHGIDYGYAYEGGERTDRVCIRFHTREKISLQDLDPSQRLPDLIDDVEVDVVVAAYSVNGQSPRDLQDPVRPGVSIGNLVTGETGTLGALVRDISSNVQMIVSNWHVLCGGAEAAVGNVICQPGPFDLGSNSPRTIATLERWLRLSEQFDAAVATVVPGVRFDEEIFGTSNRLSSSLAPAIGQKLTKSGAVSGTSSGTVDAVAGTYMIDYSSFGDHSEWMAGFRVVGDSSSQPLSLDGDSGSVWFDSTTGAAVGLHFAGEDFMNPLNDYALAHSIQPVLTSLNVRLV